MIRLPGLGLPAVRPATPARHGRPVLLFAVVTAAAFVVAATGVLWIVYRASVREAETELALETLQVINGVLEPNLLPSDVERPATGPRLEKLDRLVDRLVFAGSPPLELKLWSRGGVLVYSTGHGAIGQRVEPDEADELRGVLRGRVHEDTTEIRRSDGSSTAALEAFVPLRLARSGPPAGAVEVYIHQGLVAAHVRKTFVPIAAVLGAALAVLYAFLIPMLRRITSTLERRNEELEAHRRELADRVDALQRAERRAAHLAAIVHSSEDAITSTDVDGTIQSWNSGAERMYGYSAEDVIGKPASVLVPDELTDDFQEIAARLLRGESVEPYEAERLAKDGARLKVSMRVSLIRADDEGLSGVSQIARDVTRQSELEEELRHAQKMDAVGRVAGGIAHDFNNLLMAILGHSELLLDSAKHDGDQNRHVREIKSAAERAGELTRQLLAYSRKQILDLKVVDLNDVVRESAGLVESVLGDHIELVVSLDSDALFVNGDPAQLQQILLNLAANARDAMRDGGTFSIDSRSHTAEPAMLVPGIPLAASSYAVLEIRDNGSGMNEETCARIFEPFFTTKDVGEGTGLGLASVHGIVAQSSGEIVVESAPGAGTTFTIYLPQADPPARTKPSERADFRASSRSVVLVVDDTDVVRTLLRDLIEEAGHAVLEARNGLEALAVFEASGARPSVVLTDLVMPRMSGTVLADRIREISPETAIIYMSGFSDEATSGALPDGAAFLAKPFTRDALDQALRAACRPAEEPLPASAVA